MKERGKGEEEGVHAEQVIFDVQVVVLLTRSSSSSWRSLECNREHRTIWQSLWECLFNQRDRRLSHTHTHTRTLLVLEGSFSGTAEVRKGEGILCIWRRGEESLNVTIWLPRIWDVRVRSDSGGMLMMHRSTGASDSMMDHAAVQTTSLSTQPLTASISMGMCCKGRLHSRQHCSALFERSLAARLQSGNRHDSWVVT